ncbi:hypothetical protein [Streptomyces sp. Mg1]|uniref:hypothetical protein n=1 Tax=Streptomyces sp. Mg1 TaxID=465541 RepID=UPI00017EA3DF|nr:conserved hypothetical protein [Streptomyces sp. Mg1]
MQLEAITWQRMAERLAGHLDDRDTPSEQAVRQRVGIDGAPAADTGVLAGHLADALRERGRAALAVPAAGFLRPASLRFEFGREDVDAYLDGWYDTAALWREVFGPTDPGGSGRVNRPDIVGSDPSASQPNNLQFK